MSLPTSCPRLVIGGVASGVGKTTLAVALTRALRGRGLRVSVFKCGPDYLDPTYHRRAAGSPCHNLDGWMMGRDAVLDTFARASVGADLAVIEGVMGLFDGASPTGEAGSTAEIAKWLRAPVALVADAGGMARSVAALTQGFAAFDPELRVAGLICNRIGSRGHLDLLRQSVRQTVPRVPVLGGLPRAGGLEFPERHLGLRTADEAIPEAHFEGWARLAEEWLDLDAIVALARSAPELPAASADASTRSAPSRCRIGLAMDAAFHFYYEDNLARLKALGAELVPFSPIRDSLPAVDGLYIGGGYPELFARELSANTALLEQLRAFAAAGRPIYAECGGLMLLGRALHTVSGERFPLAGVLPLETRVCDRLQALGYVEVETQAPSILGAAGLRFRGHQFRYSEVSARETGISHVYTLRVRRGGETRPEGYGVDNVLASYVHAHWASNPRVAEGFVAACVAAAARAGAPRPAEVPAVSIVEVLP